MTRETTKNTDVKSELQVAEHTASRRREDLLKACGRAVECLERSAAEARRAYDRAEREPARLVDLPVNVLSMSAWATTNATSELSTATRLVTSYMYAVDALDALKTGAR